MISLVVAMEFIACKWVPVLEATSSANVQFSSIACCSGVSVVRYCRMDLVNTAFMLVATPLSLRPNWPKQHADVSFQCSLPKRSSYGTRQGAGCSCWQLHPNVVCFRYSLPRMRCQLIPCNFRLAGQLPLASLGVSSDRTGFPRVICIWGNALAYCLWARFIDWGYLRGRRPPANWNCLECCG